MSQIKLSIIVPIYNVEPYLRKCVESLLTQDLDPAEYEIILVDDGSTDGSGELAEQLVGKSEEGRGKSVPRITAIHQPNGGLSAARNTGIMAAKGDYVCFVDSDDYWEPNVLGGLMAQVERDDLDVLRFNYRNVNELGQEIHPNKNPKQYSDYSEEVCSGVEFLNNRLGYACYAVQFIIRRSLLVGSSLNTKRSSLNVPSILFTPGIYFEDTDWTPRMLLAAQRVASTDTMVYNYLWRVGSITLAVDKVKKQKIVEDKMRLIGVFAQLQNHTQDDTWLKWQLSALVMSILGVIIESFYAERKIYIYRIKQFAVLPLSTLRANRSQRIKIRLANLSMNIYCVIMHCALK